MHADPLLVERILRNLVNNAIRYTNDGGVLVAARAAAARSSCWVWDSGLGIPREEQARVFGIQTGAQYAGGGACTSARPGPGAGHRRRLADLMGAPLTLRSRSRPRHGVHARGCPRARGPPSLGACPGGVPGLTLAGRSISWWWKTNPRCAGLEVLLQGWGARVFSFDSMADSGSGPTPTDRTQIRPELLIVDYRLEAPATASGDRRAARALSARRCPPSS